MRSQAARASQSKTDWRANTTLFVSVASFITTATVGILAYNIDARAKTFESAGYLETRYFGVDLRNYCGSAAPKVADADIGRAPDSEFSEDSYNLYEGYIQNDVWLDAKSRLDKYCDALEVMRSAAVSGDQDAYAKAEAAMPEGDNVSDSALVYMEVSSKTSLFSISPTLNVQNIPKAGKKDIWDYANLSGTEEHYPLGSIRINVPVRVPIAIVSNRVPTSRLVVVPKSIEWKSPISGSKTTVQTDFVVSGRYWRSMRIGVTAS